MRDIAIREGVGYVLIGVVIGFFLSAAFFLFWGAFQIVGFFLWSILGGGGGALAGGLLARRTRWAPLAAVIGAIAVRVAIFVMFGTY